MLDYTQDAKDLITHDIEKYTSNLKFLRKCIITACCWAWIVLCIEFLAYLTHVKPLYGMYIWVYCVISICLVYFYIQFRQNLEKLMIAKEVRVSFITDTLANE